MIPYFSFKTISIGPVNIYIWGLFLVLGLLFSIFYSLRKAEKRGIDPDLFLNAVFYLVIGLVVGARLGHVLQYLDHYIKDPISIFKVWQGGLAFHGGLIGLFLAGLIFVVIKKISWTTFFLGADAVSLAAPLGIAIGRIGCSLINDHQGAGAFFGIVWPDGVIRHPVAEYLIIANILLFFILKYFYDKPQSLGKAFFAFLLFYSVFRFFLDFTRSTGTPLSDPRYFSLSTAQWLSLAVILGIMIKGLVQKGRLSIG